VEHVSKVAQRGTVVEVDGSGTMPVLVAAALVAHGIVPTDLRVEQPSLEDVFLELTGRTSMGDQ
jgi:ABC-2 type transport system ATP-binding protein